MRYFVVNEHIAQRAATIKVTDLALSNSARSHYCELTQRMRASIMHLRRPTFLPSITDRMR